MPRPNFTQGKPVAQLLVGAILTYADDDTWFNGGRQLTIQPEVTSDRNPVLRVKGDRTVLLALVEAYGRSPQPLLTEDSNVFTEFLQKSEKEQLQALKNAHSCLLEYHLIEDQREQKTNSTIRHFLLRLRYGAIIVDHQSRNFDWLFGEGGQWDLSRQKNRSPSQSQAAPVMNPVVRWARLLPDNLCEYTPDRLEEIEELIPDLEPLTKGDSRLDRQDQIFIIENLLRFYFSTQNQTKVETFLQQFEQMLFRQSPDHSYANYYHYLGVYYYQHQHHNQAKKAFENSLNWRKAHCDKTTASKFRLADTLHNLACVELESRNLRCAEQRIVEAISIYHKSRKVKDLANSLMTLGNVRSEQTRFAEAEDIYLHTLRDFGAILTQHPLLAYLHTGLGHLYAKQGQYHQAREHYCHGITHLTSLYGDQSHFLAIPQAGLAALEKLLLED